MSTRIVDNNAIHTYTESEKVAYVNFVNRLVGSDPYLVDNAYVPIDPSTDQVFQSLKDGQVLACVVHHVSPQHIDLNKIMRPKEGKKLNPF